MPAQWQRSQCPGQRIYEVVSHASWTLVSLVHFLSVLPGRLPGTVSDPFNYPTGYQTTEVLIKIGISLTRT